IGGSLNHKHGTYVERKADQDLFNLLNSNEYCFVLNSRQMGKSSLRVRINKKLVSQGIKCAFIDLSLIGTHVTLEKWYKAMAYEILSTLDLHSEINFSSWWKQYDFLTEVQRLIKLIESVLFPHISSNIVIFIDEIDTLLKLDFKDDFFAFIRGCYNMRSQNPEYERLTFCLLGVATPTDLIQDQGRTPFNIGHSIELTGFTFAEAKNSLIPGLQDNFDHPETILQEVLYWSGGQPFLTQKICSLIVEFSPEIPVNVSQLIQEYLIENWETQDEPEHLRTIRDRLLSNPDQTIELLSLYQQILTNPENPIFANFSDVQTELRLSGLVVQNNNILQVYNPIYKAIFNQDWIQEQLNNIRPYSTSLNQWLKSQNPIYLLQENELITAKQWTIDKRLSQEDYQFISASQGEEDRLKNQQYQQKNQELLADIEKVKTAHKKAEKMIKIGGLTLIITSIASVILAVTASIYTNKQINLFKKTMEIEKSGVNTLKQFQNGENSQIDSLISAIKQTQELKNLVNNEQNLVNYPTTTPIQTLLTILTEISQKNEFQIKEKDPLNIVNLSPDGQMIVSGDTKGKIKFWHIDGTLIKTINTQGKINLITFSSDGEIIASGSNKGEIKLWRKDGTLINTLTHNNSKINSINFSSDNNMIVSGSYHGTIKIWRKDGTLINTIKGHEGAVYSVNFSPDNLMIVSSGNDNKIKLWRKDGTFIRDITKGNSPFKSVNFDFNSEKNKQQIVSGNNENIVQIWDLEYGILRKTLYGHNDEVNTVSFTPNNQIIISGSKDKTIKLWGKDGTYINTLNGHKDEVSSIKV
ncbi:MAG TPA: AAA-like domain-containing protein, partial [Allocoleopsis sp.]